MKPALALLLVLSIAGISASQDLKVREEAIRLMERANAVSSSPKLPNLERVDTFRVFGDAGAQEGSFSRVVIQGTGRREEFSFGDYHLVNVWTQKQVAVTGSPHILPAELMTVLRITPISHGRFDEEDVIHAITERPLGGRAARCIAFDTIRGQHTENNEICVDAANGTLLLEKLGERLVQYSEFFSFAGVLMPGKITYSQSGVQRMEIAQTMTELTAADANVLAPPMNAQMHKLCTTYRRPFGVSMPQPPGGSGGGNADVVIRAMVGVDGKVFEATVQSSEREDLKAEALALAKQWTFTPSMCDGHPDAHEADVTLHFQGR
jgi:Gram-negative bacterial TonB protein C-terminal